MSTLPMLVLAVALVAVVWRASHGSRAGRISETGDAASGTPYADGSDGSGTPFGDDASTGSDCADSGGDGGGCDGGGDGGGGD